MQPAPPPAGPPGHRGWSIAKRLRAAWHDAIRRRLWRTDIGARTIIDPAALIDRTWPRGVHIGPDCWIGADAVVLTHDFTRGIYVDTRIGARCRIGIRAVILPGVTIGDDCIVQPGSLVLSDMPAGSIAVGSPARITPRDAA